MVWAFATFGHRSEALLAPLAAECLRQLHNFTCKYMADMLWGFATLAYTSTPLLAGLERRSRGMVTRCQPRVLAKLMWGFATLGHTKSCKGQRQRWWAASEGWAHEQRGSEGSGRRQATARACCSNAAMSRAPRSTVLHVSHTHRGAIGIGRVCAGAPLRADRKGVPAQAARIRRGQSERSDVVLRHTRAQVSLRVRADAIGDGATAC